MNVRRRIITFMLLSVISLQGVVHALSAGSEKSGRDPGAGERFHRDTALTWRRVIQDAVSFKPQKPPQYKTYPDARRIQLPAPGHSGISVEEAIRKRRSVRNYSADKLSVKDLSQLLFAAQGTTGRVYGQALRSAPSAGALYPFEVYLIVNNVQSLSPGIYHYAVLHHELELMQSGDFSKEVTDAGLRQDMLGSADVTFVLASVFDRVRHKYGERGYRYAYIEAGHISQNIYLQAVSLGLGSVSVGAFFDDKINELISVDGTKEAVIYLHAVGTL